MDNNKSIEAMNSLIHKEASSLSLPNKQQEYLHQATAANTRRAYQAAIRQFEAHGCLLPATEEAVARYVTDKASDLNPRTLSLHLTALSHWHCYQNFWLNGQNGMVFLS